MYINFAFGSLGKSGRVSDDTTIHYHPVDVLMICFIRIAFNQLKNSIHSTEYGRFGIVLTDSFLKISGIRPVYYYTEETLWNDPLVDEWNHGRKALSAADKLELEKEIVSFRKPASLFPSFSKSVVIRLTRASDGAKVQYLTYDRYPIGYDFRKEREYRIVFNEGIEHLSFDEKDVLMVVTPDTEAKNDIEAFLNQNWQVRPEVTIYPA